MIEMVIVDDDASFRRRIRDVLSAEPDMEIVGEAANGHEALRKARELKPNLITMDVRMPGMNGLEALRRLKDEMPETKIIVLTMYDLLEYREAAKASGASDYVVKRDLIDALIPAIRHQT